MTSLSYFRSFTIKNIVSAKAFYLVNLDYKFEGIGIGTQSHRYRYPGVVSSRLVDHWCLMFSPSLEVISVMSKNEAQRNKLGSMVGKVFNTWMTQRCVFIVIDTRGLSNLYDIIHIM